MLKCPCCRCRLLQTGAAKQLGRADGVLVPRKGPSGVPACPLTSGCVCPASAALQANEELVWELFVQAGPVGELGCGCETQRCRLLRLGHMPSAGACSKCRSLRRRAYAADTQLPAMIRELYLPSHLHLPGGRGEEEERTLAVWSPLPATYPPCQPRA